MTPSDFQAHTTAGVEPAFTPALTSVPIMNLRRPAGLRPQVVSCAGCCVRKMCVPSAVTEPVEASEEATYARKRLKRDELLCHMGAAADSVYAVRSGFLESRTAVHDGREQVTGFHMPGDLVGIDAISSGTHATAIVALEDAEVCVIPYARLEQPEVRRHVHQAMTHELSRAQRMVLALGTLRAEERIAAFLVAFSERMRALGYARDDFNMRMSRQDIGSYLGMSLETVCRILMRFHRTGLIHLHQKHVRILDMPALMARAALGR